MKHHHQGVSLVHRNTFRGAVIAVALVVLVSATPAEEIKEVTYIPWRDGLWRTELSTFSGIRSGRRSRTGDTIFNGTLEYEIPVGERSTTGIRVHPLLSVYNENLTGQRIWAFAVGPTVRVYRKNSERYGLFGELQGSVVWKSAEFRGNTSRINFLAETGVGYKFRTDWHVSAKVRHVSNAGIDSNNSGANAIGLAMGYTF